jgi:hypothetical protein
LGLLDLAVNRVTAIKGAVLFDLQATRGPPLVFGGRIVFVFAFGALKLNDVPGHGQSFPFILNPGLTAKAFKARVIESKK